MWSSSAHHLHYPIHAGDCGWLVSSVPSPMSFANLWVLWSSLTQVATNLVFTHISGNCGLLGVTPPIISPGLPLPSSCTCQHVQQTSVVCITSQLGSRIHLWVLQLNSVYKPVHMYANGYCHLAQPSLPPALALMATSRSYSLAEKCIVSLLDPLQVPYHALSRAHCCPV